MGSKKCWGHKNVGTNNFLLGGRARSKNGVSELWGIEDPLGVRDIYVLFRFIFTFHLTANKAT